MNKPTNNNEDILRLASAIIDIIRFLKSSNLIKHDIEALASLDEIWTKMDKLASGILKERR